MWSHANSLFCAVIIQPPLCTASTWLIRQDISNVQMYFWKHSKNLHVLGSSSLDWRNSLWVNFKTWDVLCCGYKDLDCNHPCVFSQEPVDWRQQRWSRLPDTEYTKRGLKSQRTERMYLFLSSSRRCSHIPFHKECAAMCWKCVTADLPDIQTLTRLNNVKKKKKGHLDICSEDKCGVSV